MKRATALLVLLVVTACAEQRVTNPVPSEPDPITEPAPTPPTPPGEEPPPEEPTPPVDEPAPTPPGEEPAPTPPGEEPAPNPPGEEPPGEQPPSEEPSAPSGLVVTKTPPGPAPWAIQYTLEHRQGVKVELECEGFSNGKYAQCIHTDLNQGLNVTVTLEDGTVEQHFIESGMAHTQGEVPFGGSWYYDAGDVDDDISGTIQITNQVSTYGGCSDDGLSCISLNSDGTLTLSLDILVIVDGAKGNLIVSEGGEQFIYAEHVWLAKY